MSRVPENRTLLSVDVVDSARNRGYHVKEIVPAVEGLLLTALRRGELSPDEVLDWESTGDGAVLTLHDSYLGAVLDAAEYLDRAAEKRNQQYKPEIRLRVAVESGPVGQARGYYPAKATLDRMLNAPEFKALFNRCRDIGDPDEVNTALIVSDHVKRVAFSGDYLGVLREGEFVRLPVRNKEYAAEAWVRVPGFDRRSTADLIAESAKAESDAAPQPDFAGAVDEPEFSNVNVHNEMSGNHNNSVQAGVIHGGVHNGQRSP